MNRREGLGTSGGQIIEMPMLLKSPWKQGMVPILTDVLKAQKQGTVPISTDVLKTRKQAAVPILTDVLKAWKYAGKKIRL